MALDWRLNASTGQHILDVSATMRIVRSNAQPPYIYRAEDRTGSEPGELPPHHISTSMETARAWLRRRVSHGPRKNPLKPE